MKTAPRAIGYSAAIAVGFSLFVTVWMGVLIGVSELAVSLGASHKWAPLYGLGAWGVIACVLIGTGAAIEAGKKEAANAAA